MAGIKNPTADQIPDAFCYVLANSDYERDTMICPCDDAMEAQLVAGSLRAERLKNVRLALNKPRLLASKQYILFPHGDGWWYPEAARARYFAAQKAVTQKAAPQEETYRYMEQGNFILAANTAYESLHNLVLVLERLGDTGFQEVVQSAVDALSPIFDHAATLNEVRE